MIVPERILFDKDFTDLREYIYKNCYVKYIISLPRKIFYAREVKVSILYLTNIRSEVEEKI
jgi:type I restriction-modification system DNA methylase subunit